MLHQLLKNWAVFIFSITASVLLLAVFVGKDLENRDDVALNNFDIEYTFINSVNCQIGERLINEACLAYRFAYSNFMRIRPKNVQMFFIRMISL